MRKCPNAWRLLLALGVVLALGVFVSTGSLAVEFADESAVDSSFEGPETEIEENTQRAPATVAFQTAERDTDAGEWPETEFRTVNGHTTGLGVPVSVLDTESVFIIDEIHEDESTLHVEEGETLVVVAEIVRMEAPVIETLDDGTEEEAVLLYDMGINGMSLVTVEIVELEMGESQKVELEWDTDVGNAVTDEVWVETEDSSETVDVTIEEKPPTYDVVIDETESTLDVREGEEIAVTGEMTNTGNDDVGSEAIRLENFDGETVHSTSVSLDHDESTTVTLVWETDEDDAGTGTVRLESSDDADTAQAEILGEPPAYDVSILETNDPVVEGETVSVTADIQNTGEEPGIQDISLIVDGSERDVETDLELSGGTSETVTLEWQTEIGDAGAYSAAVSSENDTGTTDLTVETPAEPPHFDVTITDTDDPVVEGATVAVTAEVHNTGETPGSQDIGLAIDGTTVDAVQEMSVDVGERESVTLEWETGPNDVGTSSAVVTSSNESDETTVTVEQAPDPAHFALTIIETNTPVVEGDVVTVTAEVHNTGDQQGTQELRLDLDGKVVDRLSEVSLGAGASKSLTLEWQTASTDSGTATATVESFNGSDGTEVTVQAPLEPPHFAVTIVETNAPITAGDNLDVTATIENVGEERDTQDITLAVPNTTVRDRLTNTTLEPDEALTETFTWETLAEADETFEAVVHSDDDVDSAAVGVHTVPAFDVTITEADEQVQRGDNATVTAAVTNTGAVRATQTLTFAIEGTVTDERQLTLEANSTQTFSFQLETDEHEPDSYRLAIASNDDEDATTTEIIDNERETGDDEPDEDESSVVSVVDGLLLLVVLGVLLGYYLIRRYAGSSVSD